jgi:hypothetical protein
MPKRDALATEMKIMPVSVPTFAKIGLRRPHRSTTMLYYVLAIIIMLYLALPSRVLLLLGWHYVGGGSGIEKIHPATYLLLFSLCISLVFDQQFRWRVTARVASDSSLLCFIAAVTVTAAYAYLGAAASIAPFVDTFFSAIVTTIIITCMPKQSLTFLRRLVDIFFIINVLLIFTEVILQRDFLSEYLVGVVRTPEELVVLGAQRSGDFGRISALFGHPLDAAFLFGIYSISNLVSTPPRFSRMTVGRVGLSLLSYLAIFPSQSRSSMVVTGIILLLYMTYSAVSGAIKGYVDKASVAFAFFCMFLWSVGFFDPMLSRFQYDYGSALSRDYALEILQQASTSDLWFGLPVAELDAIQQSFGIIAIEISWVNFILVGGLITTIPLFATLCLFLFRSLRLYCDSGIYFVSLLILESTFASNSIWSKTTVLTGSLIVGISFLRRNDAPLKYQRAPIKASRVERLAGMVKQANARSSR